MKGDRQRDYGRRHYLRNGERVRDRSRAAYQADPGRVIARSADYKRQHPDAVRRSRLKSRYGITPERVEELLDEQGRACGICRIALSASTAHIDHDHRTGRVRGVLCGLCNRALGAFLDSREILFAAASYLANAEASVDEPLTLWSPS